MKKGGGGGGGQGVNWNCRIPPNKRIECSSRLGISKQIRAFRVNAESPSLSESFSSRRFSRYRFACIPSITSDVNLRCIVCTPPPFLLGEGGWTSKQIFKKGEGLVGPQLSEGCCWERGGDFIQGRLQFSYKNQLKSEIFNDKKKIISKNIFLS